jgi:hypothetical protein
MGGDYQGGMDERTGDRPGATIQQLYNNHTTTIQQPIQQLYNNCYFLRF